MSRTVANAIRTISLVLAAASVARAEIAIAQKGAKLVLKGNGANDTFSIEGNGAASECRVFANGVLANTFIGVRDLIVIAGGGDDIVEISALQIGGSLTVKTGTGADRIDIRTEAGAVFVENIIGGNCAIDMGGQAGDLLKGVVSLDRGMIIGGNLLIANTADVDLRGGGSSSVSEVDDIFVGGNLIVKTTVAHDSTNDARTLRLDSVNVGGKTQLKLSNDVDFVDLLNCHFVQKVGIDLRGAADTLFVSGNSTFDAQLSVNGGSGGDLSSIDATCVFAAPTVFSNVETKQ